MFNLLNKLNRIRLFNNVNLKYSFLFGLVLDKLNINLDNLPDDNGSHYSFALGIFILSLVCLLCFINVIGYLISVILLRKYDIETKFPKLKMFIRYFENSSLIFVFIEGFMYLFFLFFIVIITLLEIIY